jgi:imidazolonepropionase-like amidohydrolase
MQTKGAEKMSMAKPIALNVHAILLFLATMLVAPVASANETTIVLRCGRIIDVVAGRASGPATIVIRGERIESIGNAPAPADAAVVDLSSMTCLPGLMDLHAHIQINPDSLTGSDLARSSAARALDGLHNARTMLQAGFTTLRDPGEFDRYFSTVAVRDAIASGKAIGPRLFVAPHALGPTGGHGDFNALADDLHIEVPTRVANGADEIRRTIREEIKYGADWIKVMATGGVMSAGDNPNHTAYTDEELRAAVDETHRLGRKITVHAIGTEGIKAAVEAGVDSVEHGILIDDETIALMKQRGTWLVPTIYVLNYVVDNGAKVGFPAESIAKGRALREARDKRLRRAFAAGVKIAFGSDTIFPHGDAVREFAELVRLGLSNAEAVRAATVNAAQLLGIADEVGTLERGKLADIVAVSANPLDDIRTLEQVRFVMKGGRIVKQVAP